MFGFFCCCKRRKKSAKKMITEIYEFWFFWSKNGRFVTHICFPKKSFAWNPYFYCVWGVSAFWAKVSKKKEIFEKPPKKRKHLTDNWKAPFLVFLLFFWGLFHLALNPPYFFFFCFFFVFFCFFVVFVGGFKGQVRWPEGPPHLTLKPSKKNKKNKKKENKTKQKTNKEGLGPSEVALRATSHDP